MNMTGKLDPSTSTSMKTMKRLRYEKYRAYPGSSRMYPTLNRWIRLPTPVTISSMTTESWSTWNARSIWSRSTGSQGQSVTMTGACGGCRQSSRNTPTETAKAPSSVPGPTHRDEPLGLGPPERQGAVRQEPGERQGDRQPDHVSEGHQPRSRLMFWRSTDCLCRKIARMIARPTAASAAATVMTKKTMM